MRLVAAVFAEARGVGCPVPSRASVVCNTLIALNIVDAAAAIDHPPMPGLFGPRSPSLAEGAAARKGRGEVELLAKVFENAPAAAAFFQERGWNLAAVERYFLERWVETHTGFPEVLGPEYPARCQQALLEEARQFDEAGKPQQARDAVDLLRRLIPANSATLDQLAKLAWHRGEIDEAAQLLERWTTAEPADPTPLLRLAVLEQQRDRGETAATIANCLRQVHRRRENRRGFSRRGRAARGRTGSGRMAKVCLFPGGDTLARFALLAAALNGTTARLCELARR